jgi:hypothetical protein
LATARWTVLSCRVRLLIVDDLHFLRWRDRAGLEVSNHFKYVANEFPVTLLFIGVGLEARGLFEGTDYADAVLAQTGRRTTRLNMAPFLVDSEPARRNWRRLLLAIEQRLGLDRRMARDAGRRTVRLPIRPQHRTHRLADDVAAVPPPYVLVGHSFGGLLSAMYAGSYPTEVVGLVLIDPTTPTDADSFTLIPERDRAAAAAAQENNAENLEFDETLEQAKAVVPEIPNIPVLVLAATRGMGDRPGRRRTCARHGKSGCRTSPRRYHAVSCDM